MRFMNAKFCIYLSFQEEGGAPSYAHRSLVSKLPVRTSELECSHRYFAELSAWMLDESYNLSRERTYILFLGRMAAVFSMAFLIALEPRARSVESCHAISHSKRITLYYVHGKSVYHFHPCSTISSPSNTNIYRKTDFSFVMEPF
ncbi:hypothetical protein BDZ45DRAFT_468023 [Acephala macrosclerotiorum]|nr:hypothetical protein BDZ45DRAFT_468023 [Acephala macrosclerotiorum]